MQLADHTFFQSFSPVARGALLAATRRESFRDGVVVFQEGDPSDAMFVVLAGEVALTRQTPRGGQVELARIGENDYFGEMGIVDERGRSTTARAVGHADLGKIPAAMLLELLHSECAGDIGIQLLKRVSLRLRTTNTLFVDAVLRKEKIQLVGEMANSIIHDFKNPMAAIRFAAGIITKTAAGNETVARYAGMIDERVVYMVAMAQDLLDYARGHTALSLEAVALPELFGDVQAMHEESMRENGIEGGYTALPCRVLVDRTRILRVFQNLISNAIDAVPAEGGRIEVSARSADSKFVEIFVVDNGAGIPESIRQRLFEPFVTAGKKEGVGLGMAVARSLVEAHGGTLTFQTATGAGTTFTLRLPLASA